MTFLDKVLDPPQYGIEKNGFEKDGKLYVPTHAEIFGEFFRRLNVFSNPKNWLTSFGWFMTFMFVIPFFYFAFNFLSFKLVLIGFVYSMIIMGSHGTFWLHRYCTHRAFKFKNKFWLQVCRNLVIKVIPEEIYVISHHVHHQFPEKPGDPYNVHGGWLYCFLSDANHQSIARNLSEQDYGQLCKLMSHTGVQLNTYSQYLKFGTLCHPLRTVLHYFLNWGVWYLIFFLIGGHTLAISIFGAAGFWAFGVRSYNYEGHAGGKDKRRDGIDFNRNDLSINQKWPGFVAGEWHNNHHMFPNGARSGFLSYQMDLPWYFIWCLHKIGAVSSYRDYKEEFLKRIESAEYEPYPVEAR